LLNIVYKKIGLEKKVYDKVKDASSLVIALFSIYLFKIIALDGVPLKMLIIKT